MYDYFPQFYSTAEKYFIKISKAIKNRRVEAFDAHLREIAYSCDKNHSPSYDPADEDKELEEKLRHNASIGKKRMAEVIFFFIPGIQIFNCIICETIISGTEEIKLDKFVVIWVRFLSKVNLWLGCQDSLFDVSSHWNEINFWTAEGLFNS